MGCYSKRVPEPLGGSASTAQLVLRCLPRKGSRPQRGRNEPPCEERAGGVNTRAWEHPKGRGSMPRAVGHPEASTCVTFGNTGGQTVVLHRVCPRAPRCERRRASAEGCVVLLRVPVQVRYPRAPRCERRRASAEGCVRVCPCSALALVSLVPPPPLVLRQEMSLSMSSGAAVCCVKIENTPNEDLAP